MKPISFLLCFFVSMSLVLPSAAVGFGEPSPEKKEGVAVKEGVLLIDDFESGSLKTPRDWWTFDIEKAEASSNSGLKGGDEEVAAQVGNYSLLLKGGATNWYAGGCGTYLAKEKQDLSGYNSIQIDIYGNGPGSGTLKVELFDDDNRNWQVEQDPTKAYAPVYDDKLVYDIRVDWKGWRREIIPLDDFVDDNPGVGDDVWNPEQAGGSGGLLQLQFICVAGKADGSVNYNLDNILLSVEEE